MVGEAAVEFGIHHLELDHGEPTEHDRNDEAAHPVGRVRDDPHRRDPGSIHEGHHVVGELLEHVASSHGAA
jgi:hypothetical protein